MPRSLIGLIGLALLGGFFGLGHADPVELPNTKTTLDVPTTWKKLAAPALVAAWQGPDGMVLAVARAQVPAVEARNAKTRDAFFDKLERGAIAAVPGQKKLARKIADIHGVPVLDLELSRSDGSRVVMRVLLYRTFALSATVAVPKGLSLDTARGITTTLLPPKPDPPKD